MKKILFGAAIMVLGLASCNNSTCDTTATCGNDSLSNAYGDYVGLVVRRDFDSRNQGDAQASQEFLKGLQLAFSSYENNNTVAGMQVASSMLGEIDQLSQQGVNIDRAKVLEAFKKAFTADSIAPFRVEEASMQFRQMINKAMEEAEAAKAAEASKAPDAVENGKAAEAFVADAKKQNPAIQTSATGLSYLVSEEGSAPKASETSTVVVNYTGRHLNGEVFDSTDDRGPATFNLQGVVPGFREGLMLLGKGGKATLYIPGELAYGPQGMPQAGIGPNEMLVFQVEVLDVDPQ